MKSRSDQIKRASWIAILGNALLAAVKIGAGLLSGSLAVVGDGIDSTTDIVTSLIILITSKIIDKPPDSTHPYGHTRADTIAAKLLAFVIFFAGAQLALSTSTKIFDGVGGEVPALLAVYVTVFSIMSKIVLSYILFNIGEKTESSMLLANAKNMKNDVIISSGVLLGLFFTIFMGKPVLDQITAFIISIYIMKSAIEIFMETNTELMDGTTDKSIYTDIFRIVDDIDGVHNPHRTRVRKLGHMIIIDIDIEVKGSLTVLEAHRKAMEVEEKIKKTIKNVYDIIIHIEPLGNVEHKEKFGISSGSNWD